MGVEMLEDNEQTALPRTGDGFVNDMKILTKSKYRGDEAFAAASGGILNNKEKAAKSAATRVRSKFGAAIQNCTQGQELLSQIPPEIERIQKALTTVKKAIDRAPLDGELRELYTQEARIKAAMKKLNCVTAEDVENKQNTDMFNATLSQLTSAASATAPTAEKPDNTLMYVGVGVGVLLVGGLLIFAMRS